MAKRNSASILTFRIPCPKSRQRCFGKSEPRAWRNSTQTIPERLRLKRAMNLPEPLLSEVELKKHVEAVLSRNTSCRDYLSFLGGGCSQHDVPAVCDEINQRSEFLTAYAGEPFEDHGRFQALFEYESLMGELLDIGRGQRPRPSMARRPPAPRSAWPQESPAASHVLVSDTVSPDQTAW